LLALFHRVDVRLLLLDLMTNGSSSVDARRMRNWLKYVATIFVSSKAFTEIHLLACLLYYLLFFYVAKSQWTTITVNSAVSRVALYGSKAVVHDDVVYVFGGLNQFNDLSKSLYSFNPTTMTWKTVLTDGDEPVARALFSMDILRDRIVCFGGKTEQSEEMNSLSIFSLTDLVWMNVKSRLDSPPPRFDHATVKLSRKLNDMAVLFVFFFFFYIQKTSNSVFHI
jgi:hypothetical protein